LATNECFFQISALLGPFLSPSRPELHAPVEEVTPQAPVGGAPLPRVCRMQSLFDPEEDNELQELEDQGTL